MIAGPSVWLTLSTALPTPLPSQRFLSPSRSSSASCSPVDAPLGTAARPRPLCVCTSTSTVGLPRESRISRARTAVISLIAWELSYVGRARDLHPEAPRLVERSQAPRGGEALEERAT